MKNMDHIFKVFLPCVKWIGVFSIIGLTVGCNNESSNRAGEKITPPVEVEETLPSIEQQPQLQFKLEALDFKSICNDQSCPSMNIQRLSSNYKALDEAVDRYIYNYMGAFLQGFDVPESTQEDNSKPQVEQKSLVKEIQDIKDLQNPVKEAGTNLEQPTKQLLQQQLHPYVEKFIALGKEVKSLGSQAQLSVFIKPQILNPKGPVTTIVINANNYVGGAHGSSAQQYINFDLGTEKVLNLDGIIQPNKRKDLNQLVYQKFEAWVKESQPDIDFKEYENLWSFKLSTNFYLAPQGLVFQYGEYEIGPYASGLPRLVVPYNELDLILKSQYLPEPVIPSEPSQKP